MTDFSIACQPKRNGNTQRVPVMRISLGERKWRTRWAGMHHRTIEAWYNVEETNPVAVKKPNAWGLYDMRGNVNEWVQDWYDSKYYSKSPMADPKGPDSDAAEGGRGVRGGSFHDDGPWLTRVSLRQHFQEDYKHFDLGFRVVREKR